MKNKIFIAIIGAIIILIAIEIFSQESKVIFEEKEYQVEIARSQEELSQGLMNREHLCEDCGMLFVFEKSGPKSFWMKNTLIPLDIIFIDEKFMIVNISMAVPCKEEICKTYESKGKARYVLEVNAREFDETDIGKFIEIRI